MVRICKSSRVVSNTRNFVWLEIAKLDTICDFIEDENKSKLSTDVTDLTKEEVKALGHAVGLEISDPELTEVTYSLNAILEALDNINPPGLDKVEPLPIILPPAQ